MDSSTILEASSAADNCTKGRPSEQNRGAQAGTAFDAINKPVIALTGATGFIGQYLLRELSKCGYRLRVQLRRPTTVPMEFADAVVGDLTWPQNMAAVLAGADVVIHSAGISPAMSGSPAIDYDVVDTEATIGLARAAHRAGVRRFIFLSSIRAQCGPTCARVLTEDLEPTPTDAYGRSKLAAEQGLAKLDLDWVALRLVLIYGPGVTGTMARLMQFARSPYPLPLGGFKAQVSLLSLDNLVAAIVHVLASPQPLRQPLIVADPEPLTLPAMITAMRRGLGRRPAIFSVPTWLLEAALRMAGRSEVLERLTGPLVASPAALTRLGWVPAVTTFTALGRLMQNSELR